jgi:lipopolysaccharide/colanic/teichoic acid biosynthesis glycosyltransferase
VLGGHPARIFKPRVTRAGKFLSRTSIDELRHVSNMLLGDMALGGPRPEIPQVLARYESYRDACLSVKLVGIDATARWPRIVKG